MSALTVDSVASSSLCGKLMGMGGVCVAYQKKIAFANLYVLQRGDTEEAAGGEAAGGRSNWVGTI